MNGYEIVLRGFVQGQGIRPALVRLANQRNWTGSVQNTASGVRLIVRPNGESLADVETLIRKCHAALAKVTFEPHRTSVPTGVGFQIACSTDADEFAVPVPCDAAVCDACMEEFSDSDNRRCHDPLIGCVRCGPRFSAITSMPFDRERTTLSAYPLCAACQTEYGSTDSRRGHSQTIGCPQCEPRVWAEDRQGRHCAAGDAAARFAAAALRNGAILALRGVGGYQLLVDATNDHAVDELRRRKRRANKPFAVLCRTQQEARTLGEFDACGWQALTSSANPIVIVPRKPGRRLATGVHPHMNDIGLLLPTTALHARLLDLVDRPLVCTSGNGEGTPLAVEIEEARSFLAGIADVWLHHDRPMAHPVDDSVVRPAAGRVMTIRCARGLAPLSLSLPQCPPAVALGSFQKAACAYANGAQTVLGPHIGDLEQIATRQRWEQSLSSLQKLYRIDTATWAVDAHPDDICRDTVPVGAKPVSIWHHHAHLAAGLLEHGWLDQTVMGMAADGQGYGSDGTLWGGEVLRVSAWGFRRIASVRSFKLCGGEAAVRDPTRLAVALLSQLPKMTDETISRSLQSDRSRIQQLQISLRSSMSPATSSLGRWMEGIACLVLSLRDCSYIGEPAVRLEAACDPNAMGSYRWEIHDRSEPWDLDWRPVVKSILQDMHDGETPGIIAERVHRSIVGFLLELRARCAALPWVFSGGVFQNRRLCELLAERWPSSAGPLGLPGVIPPNDGGLAAGQLAILTAQANAHRSSNQLIHGAK